LPIAAKSGERTEVERLLARKDTDPNIIDRATGNTALHYAAAIGHEEIVICLLKHSGLDVNRENSHRTTALILASGNGNIKIIEMLLADNRTNPNHMSTSGMSALHMAAQRGRLLSVRAMLTHPSLEINQQTPDAHGADTALHMAARLGKAKVVRALIADPRIDLGVVNKEGDSAALAARDAGQGELADLLLNPAGLGSGYQVMGGSQRFNPGEGRGSFYNPSDAPAAPRRQSEASSVDSGSRLHLPAPGDSSHQTDDARADALFPHERPGPRSSIVQPPASSGAGADYKRANTFSAGQFGSHKEWENVPGLNFHKTAEPEPEKSPRPSAKWWDSGTGRASSAGEAATQPAPAASQSKSSGFSFFGSLADKLDEMRAAQHIKAAERDRKRQEAAEAKAQLMQQKRVAEEAAKQAALEQKLRDAAEKKAQAEAEKVRKEEERARKEAVARSKAEADKAKKAEAAAAKERLADDKRRAAAAAKQAQADAKQRKEQEEKNRKNAEARQQRNQSGTGNAGAGGWGTNAKPPPMSKRPSMVVETKKLWSQHEKDWERFEKSPPVYISYANVPWPLDIDDMLRGMVTAAADGKDKDAVAKGVFRKATLRWHPDKFMGKFGAKLHDSDRERILDKVKEITQSLNRAWQISAY